MCAGGDATNEQPLGAEFFCGAHRKPLGDGDAVGDLLDDGDVRSEPIFWADDRQPARTRVAVVDGVVVLGGAGGPAAAVYTQHDGADGPIGNERAQANSAG